MVASDLSHEEPLVFQLCTLLWGEEHEDGHPLTNVPHEVVELGVDKTKEFIASQMINFRLKICLVGSNRAGKTSFVKSIMSGQPQRCHDGDRTIDIDLFSFSFQQIGKKVKNYDVTFWDFVGKDTYQVASSLFFSPRTLFLVFVDIEAFTIAYMQAAIFANVEFQEPNLLGEFIDDTVMHWVRMILTHQPAADFVFIVTKEDLLDNDFTKELLKRSLRAKLAEVQATAQEMRTQPSMDHFGSNVRGGVGKSSVLFTSCKTPASARIEVEKLIAKSSLPMPELPTPALESIFGMRNAVPTRDISTRINGVFMAEDSLRARLHVEPDQSQTILRKLHDLGDVLWYEGLGIAFFNNSVILDPLLLVDFIREIYTHQQTDVTLSHADLKSMPNWICISDQKKMEAMKQLLQIFNVVHSTSEDGVMEWDSSLIVSAYWQVKKPASWLFLGDILRLDSTRTRDGKSMTIDWENDFVRFNTMTPRKGEDERVHWEFHFESGLPPALFDDLIIASVSPYFKFDTGPDWIVYEEEAVAVCRIMVGRDLKSLHRSIRVEAVVAKAASREQADRLWQIFGRLCGAFIRVLRELPPSNVSGFAWDNADNKVGLKDLVRAEILENSVKWMPPAMTWKGLRSGLAKWYEESR